jgi:hypothetical protein
MEAIESGQFRNLNELAGAVEVDQSFVRREIKKAFTPIWG